MRGHNRPPFPPKIPGTDLPSWDVPTAIIYRPARSAMTSAPRPNYWILEFEPSRPPQIDPLMGHISSDDPYRPIRLKFPDRDSAVDFAERQDWRYIVREDAPRLTPGGERSGIASITAPTPRTPFAYRSAWIGVARTTQSGVQSSRKARWTCRPKKRPNSIRSSKPRSNPSPPLILQRGRV